VSLSQNKNCKMGNKQALLRSKSKPEEPVESHDDVPKPAVIAVNSNPSPAPITQPQPQPQPTIKYKDTNDMINTIVKEQEVKHNTEFFKSYFESFKYDYQCEPQQSAITSNTISLFEAVPAELIVIIIQYALDFHTPQLLGKLELVCNKKLHGIVTMGIDGYKNMYYYYLEMLHNQHYAKYLQALYQHQQNIIDNFPSLCKQIALRYFKSYRKFSTALNETVVQYLLDRYNQFDSSKNIYNDNTHTIGIKLGLVGQNYCGKSAFMIKWVDGKYQSMYCTARKPILTARLTLTVEDTISNSANKNDEYGANMNKIATPFTFAVDVYDKHEVMGQLQQQEEYNPYKYLKPCNILMFMFSLTSLASFEELETVHLPAIKLMLGNEKYDKIPCILVGTKSELSDSRQVSFEAHVVPFMTRNTEFIGSYFEISVAADKNVTELAKHIVLSSLQYQLFILSKQFAN